MDWKEELKDSVCTLEQLEEYTDLTSKEKRQLKKVIERHPMRITRYYASLINWNDPQDPIRKMAVPSTDELNISGSYDTSGEKENTKMPGLQHKYPKTALILATNSCGTYCRHCFRKRLVGLPTEEIMRRFDSSVKYIKNHKEINNVLISGGDPLILPTKTIRRFLEKLSKIEHLDFIRIGTRVPVTFPNRILKDNELQNALKENSKNKSIYIVTHFNHPDEITKKSTAAIRCLIASNVTVNNQTVILRGVNDNAETLAKLKTGLSRIRVNPYYVFQCRPVKRVKKGFQVPLHQGFTIVENAKKLLDGHSKRFRYIMAHRTGKIEIIGIDGDDIYFKYHQAKKPKNLGKIFKKKISENAAWLDDLEKQESIQFITY
ncbi:KamA family radical SAM protein [archaeon]|nr:KamA family radical SAM protein [archaeon]